MQRTRLLMIGGFLGAGKTTAIARLARQFTDQGLRVGLVTNDQAYGLVDTHLLRAQGFEVGEVPGACFCCKFDELVETAARLGSNSQPDVILTEPVGSCTDLMATVIQPLQHLFGDRYELGPLTVLCKPEHGRKILGGATGGFSPQAAYIFLKQLEEAQLIVLNKVDRLSPSETNELMRLLQERFPDKPVLAASSTTGEGYEEITTAIAATPGATHEALEIDYDTYAEGEAALGWLNGVARFSCKKPSQPNSDMELFSLDQLVELLIADFSEAMCKAGTEPGHVKVLASAGSGIAVANWVASDEPVELSITSNANVIAAEALINARVHGDPDELAKHVRQSVENIARQLELTCELSSVQHFRPGRPVPVHRFE